MSFSSLLIPCFTNEFNKCKIIGNLYSVTKRGSSDPTAGTHVTPSLSVTPLKLYQNISLQKTELMGLMGDEKM